MLYLTGWHWAKNMCSCLFMSGLHPILFWLQEMCCHKLESDHLLQQNYGSFIFGSISIWTCKGCQISSQHSYLCVVFPYQPVQLVMPAYLPLQATIFNSPFLLLANSLKLLCLLLIGILTEPISAHMCELQPAGPHQCGCLHRLVKEPGLSKADPVTFLQTSKH